MRIGIRVKEWVKTKTSEQIFILSLLLSCVILMVFCAIVRLCGGLWFTADTSRIPVPSAVVQDIGNAILLAFELTFIYKILCRTSWKWSILIALLHTTIAYFIPTLELTNVFHLIMMIIVPIIFTRKLSTIIDVIFLYAIEIIYSMLFLVGRIGGMEYDASTNFIYGVVGAIDYKLFIVSIYLFVKYYGGVKLWSKQKRMFLQQDIRTNPLKVAE